MRVRAVLVAVALLAVASQARAQDKWWWAGGGLSIPTGDAGDVYKSGWLGTVGIAMDVKSAKGWSVGAEGIYGSNSLKAGTGSLSMTGVLGNLMYDINDDDQIHPYVYGGAGIVSSTVTGGSGKSNFAWEGAGGLTYKASKTLDWWVEVRYMNVNSSASTTLMPVVAGFSIGW
jgi:hypothetical protein